jgi:hypothetical protein
LSCESGISGSPSARRSEERAGVLTLQVLRREQGCARRDFVGVGREVRAVSPRYPCVAQRSRSVPLRRRRRQRAETAI